MKAKTKILYFYAPWDNNAYDKLKDFKEEVKRFHVAYDIIDVESESGVQMSIQHSVRNVPTIVYTRKGKEVARDKGNEAYLRIEQFL